MDGEHVPLIGIERAALPQGRELVEVQVDALAVEADGATCHVEGLHVAGVVDVGKPLKARLLDLSRWINDRDEAKLTLGLVG